MSRLEKKQIIEKILERLQDEMEANLRAAKAAHESATHEESKAEDSHDTRGVEASYLAGAQAQRAADLQQLISTYRLMTIKDFGARDPIAGGALVELELEESNKRSFYFLAPKGGGATVVVDGVTIQAVTPQSPMGEALIGLKQGDGVELEAVARVREYRVVSVS